MGMYILYTPSNNNSFSNMVDTSKIIKYVYLIILITENTFSSI